MESCGLYELSIDNLKRGWE